MIIIDEEGAGGEKREKEKHVISIWLRIIMSCYIWCAHVFIREIYHQHHERCICIWTIISLFCFSRMSEYRIIAMETQTVDDVNDYHTLLPNLFFSYFSFSYHFLPLNSSASSLFFSPHHLMIMITGSPECNFQKISHEESWSWLSFFLWLQMIFSPQLSPWWWSSALFWWCSSSFPVSAIIAMSIITRKKLRWCSLSSWGREMI